MKPKPSIISFEDKDADAIRESQKMTPEQRIDLIIEISEAALPFRSAGINAIKSDLPFIVLKRKNSAV